MIYVLSHTDSWGEPRERFLYETHFDLGDCSEFKRILNCFVRFRSGGFGGGYFTILQKFDCVAEKISAFEASWSASTIRLRSHGHSRVSGFYNLGSEVSCPSSDEEEGIVGERWRERWLTLFTDIGLAAVDELVWQWSARFDPSRVSKMVLLYEEGLRS